jgi:YwiC-like protein
MMVPHEHGAYGQLLLPIATAMAMGRPSIAGLAIAACAVAAFIAHEPALVLLCRRGARASREQRRAATRWLVSCGAVAAATAVTALALTAGADRALLGVPLAIGSIAATAMIRGRERSTAGEIAVSTALASVSLPVAVACGATLAAALTCAATFAAAFAAATVSVRAVIAGAKGQAHGERGVALATDVLLMTVVAALTLGRVILPVAVWAALPVCAVALALAAVVPPPRYLRPIGWMLVAATALGGGILVVAIR